MGWFRRLRSTILGSNLDEDVAEETRFHLDERIDEYVKSGMTYEQARLEAQRRLGNLALAREQVRDVDSFRWLGDLGQDVRYALRQLRRNPGFAIAAILTLALGIGATTAVFSVVDAVVLRPLSYADSSQLVMIDEWTPGFDSIPVNGLHFQEWRRTATSFDQIALIGGLNVNVTDSSEPERLPAARVSSELFPLLGVQPQLGRVFLADEEVPGREHVVLISNELWRRRYSADPQIVGRTISIDGVAHQVAGVLPASFHFPKLSDLYPLTIVQDRPQIWKPIALGPEEQTLSGHFDFVSIGRLKAGVSARQAASELDAVQKDFLAQMPKALGSDLRTQVQPLQDRIVGRAKTGLELMLAAVGVVLFIGCVNITNLLLARLSSRRRELAVRSAIGASRWRLTRQMIAESLTLSAVGGACGVLVAYDAIQLILALAPADLPRLDEVQVDARTVIFTLIISTIAGLVIGVSPAWQFGNADAGEAMASGMRSTASRGTGRLRFVLVSAQVALSAVCLILAGLLLHSLVNLLNVDRGFDTNHIMTVGVNPPISRYPTPEKRVAFVRTALDRLKVLPGVIDVAAANMLPLAGEGGNSALSIPGTSAPLFEHALGNIRTVSSDYFRTMGMSLQAGRLFSDADRERQVAVISMSIAKRAWPGEDPVGKRFHFGPRTAPDREVIGVINDVRGVSLEAGPSFSVYVPYWQGFFIATSFAIRTTEDPVTITPAIRVAIRSVDAELPLSALRTMEEVVEGSVAQRRFQTNLVLAFGAVAMLLASLGVYGVMSYAVTQRTTEIGIRLALGAERGAVLRMVLRQALRPIAAGVAAAVPLALGVASWLRSLLFGVSPLDPATITVACLALITAAVLAAYVPARRAANLDPLIALRYE
ncbi:MAG TPA: ABC transporter permease [Acidobacteriota bacterium]